MAKKEVVHEEPGSEKGLFRRVMDAVNPFASSEQREDIEKKKENGKDEPGFFASLWPFGKKEKAKIPEQGDARLVSKIDASLKEKGILKSQKPTPPIRDAQSEIENLELRPPTPDLRQIREPTPPPANTAEVLGHIDTKLKEKRGKSITELPKPPEASAKLFAVPRKAASRAKKKQAALTDTGKSVRAKPGASPSTTGLLDRIDVGLKRKGIEPPKGSEKASTPGGLEASQPSSLPGRERTQTGIPAPQPYREKKIELTPRLTAEKGPLFLDTGEYKAKGAPRESTEQKSQQTRKESEKSLEVIPDSVTKGPSSRPSKEKPTETKVADKRLEEEEDKGVFDQIKEDLRSIGTLLNPFSW
ncbi:MAG: hypothetical protein ACE5JU_00345 [Candidatus Binatia bacterium]